jgi:type I restriction enzyme, S subunit
MEAKPDKLLPELLPFLIHMDGFFDYAIQTSAGSLSPRTKWSHLAKYEFALPPLAEQRRIAEVLTAVEESLERYNGLIDHIIKLKRAIWFDEMDTEKWKKIHLGSIASVSSGSTPNRKSKAYWENGTVPWLTTTKVNDKIITCADEFVTPKAVKETSLKIYQPGAILVALYGEGQTRGSVAYLAIKSTINQAFAALEADKQRLDEWYLYFYLNNSYQKLRSYSQGSNQKNLSGSILQRFPIKVPPLEFQRIIVGKLRACDDQIVSLTKHLTELEALKKAVLANSLNSKAN